MEQSRWVTLCAALRAACRRVAKLPRVQYSDYPVLRLYFWAVHHERPVTWTLDRDAAHYTRFFLPRKLPSVSQLNRRVASDRFQLLLQHTHEALGRLHADAPTRTTLYVDGKPLPV